MTMKVFQIGAAGGVGRRLATLLTARGDDVTGIHRRPEQADTIAATGAIPVAGDLITTSPADLTTLLRGHDAVVFSAGAHGAGREQTTLIDGEGLVKVVDAAMSAGVRRFVLVSAFPESERGGELGEAFEHYMAVKKSADIYLTRTSLDWVIIRPGSLHDDAGTGQVTAGPAVEYGPVSRDDVAAFIAAALHEPAIRHEIIELVSGPHPIPDAIAALVKLRAPRADPSSHMSEQ
jgi:uncharacterized protein YbjT (DUF2867 family)